MAAGFVALRNEIQAMMNIGLIGCGMWGRNLARNLAQLEVLTSVADRHAKNAAEFGSAFAAKTVDVDTLIHDQSIDGTEKQNCSGVGSTTARTQKNTCLNLTFTVQNVTL